ncbi:hypothetical protein H6G33_09845 [Calothrix sp. FACHB-1219]|uniref:hypothetical protein n=1 Tax=unclassified Calothrix TaxID=2619626 RepID=UPI0016885DAB|nr:MULTISPECIES: hypothetical protein [unclassified Calothrix]MBD2201648.1 hypothetical protein [Calothrix sp. FACHB-168]MBD2217334.1 hypothetical protein [Calothrix sp. FACHB-1219]
MKLIKFAFFPLFLVMYLISPKRNIKKEIEKEVSRKIEEGDPPPGIIWEWEIEDGEDE